MRRTVFAFLLTLVGMTLFGQTYSALWKQVDEAEQKDLPRTQYDVLMKIVKKAQKETGFQFCSAAAFCTPVVADAKAFTEK